jgi:hypothetical protein
LGLLEALKDPGQPWTFISKVIDINFFAYKGGHATQLAESPLLPID